MSHGLVTSDNSLGPSDHTFGLPDHDLEPQGRYRSHGPRLVRIVANAHYKYVRQARERYRMRMTFISILLACLPFNAHMQRAFSARIQSIVRNRGGWNIMRGAAPRIRALGRTLTCMSCVSVPPEQLFFHWEERCSGLLYCLDSTQSAELPR